MRTMVLDRGGPLLLWGFLAAGTIVVTSLPAAAQSPDPLSPVVFAGQVIDTYWGNPVVAAVVRLDGTLRPDGSPILGITDDDGRFMIPDVPPGPSQVSVARLGYADLAQVIDIRADQFVEIAVIPKPVVLEGIEVYVDRLAARLRQLPYVTNTFAEVQLKLSPDLNVAEYLNSQPGFEFVPCFEDNSNTGVFRRGRDCIRTRGTMAQRPRVFIDDAPAFGGVAELTTLPANEMYRVDVIRGCGQIRVYTLTFVERTAARRSVPLLPIVC